MIDMYLKKENGNYYIYVLGKNGEPKEKTNVKIVVKHLFYK